MTKVKINLVQVKKAIKEAGFNPKDLRITKDGILFRVHCGSKEKASKLHEKISLENSLCLSCGYIVIRMFQGD